MQIRFTKLDDARHALEIERDGRRERVTLETRSTLFHDFTHFAVEEAAGIGDGFFGALAEGATLAELAPGRGERAVYEEAAMRVERAVVLLQGLAKRDEEPAALHGRLAELTAVQGEALPGWFTVEFVAAVRRRLRDLLGRWRATPFGATMELEWKDQEVSE